MPCLLRFRVLCACTCLIWGCAGWAVAADIPSGAGVVEETALPEIGAQPLSQALAEFATHTRLQLIYESQLAVGRHSRTVPAGSSASVALIRLLEGTGLDFAFLNSRTVKIFAHPAGPPLRADKHPTDIEPSTGPPNSRMLEEVVVTANKREEPLSLVPMSISVVSAEEMQAGGVRSMNEIAPLIPGLEFDVDTQTGPALISNLAIRGINAFTGSPTTGVYIDDVPIQASLNVFRNAYPVTFDLNRVEILRGPQGTLFGSSSPGGAIRFIPNDASATQFTQFYHSEVSDSQNAGVNSEVGAAVGGPIIEDRFGARVSAWYRNADGYIDRVNPLNDTLVDQDANRSTSKAVRLGLVIEPTESLRIVPSIGYQSVYVHDTPIFYTYLSDPGEGELQNGKLLRQPSRDAFTISSLKVDQRLGPVELTGITGYFDRTSDAIADYSNVACVSYYGSCGNHLGPEYPSSYTNAVPTLLTQHQTALSQELRLASTQPDARVSWLVGLFYSRSHQDGLRDTYQITPYILGIYSDQFYFSTDISVFGQLRLALSPRWHLDVGTRDGWRRGDSTTFQKGIAALIGSAGTSHTVGKFVPRNDEPRFDLSYQVNADNFFYAEVAKGARGGGVNNPANCNGNAVPTSYASDSIWNYEIGAKDLLFNHRLQLATSLYFIRWDGIQENISDPCGNDYTTNAGLVSSKGFDLTAQALLTEHLRIKLALGLTDARYDRTVLTTTSPSPGQEVQKVVVDRGTAVGSLPSVPSPWSGSVSLLYQRPLTPTTSGYFAADDIFTTRNLGPFTENDPNALNYLPGLRADPSTNRLNLRFGVIRSSWDVSLSLENALNSMPVLGLNSDVQYSTLYYARTFRPRTLGLTVDWKPEGSASRP